MNSKLFEGETIDLQGNVKVRSIDRFDSQKLSHNPACVETQYEDQTLSSSWTIGGENREI